MTSQPVRLDDLIEYIRRTHGADDALRQLSGAVLLSEHLGEVADHLIGHFVDQARRTGASWTDIGRSMGVTKQAAQKRFVPKGGGEPFDASVFSRFTDRARHVVVSAQEEARQARHDYIGTEHVLLGLLHEPEGVGCRALVALGVPLETVREAATAALGPAVADLVGHIAFTSGARRLLDLTMREALRMANNYIGTEHILLALLTAEEGTGSEVLNGLGVTKEDAENWIRRTLSDEQAG
nr:Clp protease N-terminal domain-containing protein [Sphaerisporangium fuscum]